MNWSRNPQIVVPVDFSDESLEAVDTALEIAEQPANVHVIHVLQDLSAADPGVIWGEINNDNRAVHCVDALRDKLSDDKYTDMHFNVSFGDAGHRIVEHANNVSADLIVMPSHGRRGIKRMLIGSVAERVVRLAHCPVLVLRK